MRKRTKQSVLKRANYECHYCKTRRANSVDHVHPLARGGKDNVGNLVASCKPCNEIKGAMEYDVFMEYVKSVGVPTWETWRTSEYYINNALERIWSNVDCVRFYKIAKNRFGKEMVKKFIFAKKKQFTYLRKCCIKYHQQRMEIQNAE